MDIDWSSLGWLLPLVIGAALTFGFGWLDSTLKYKRETQAAKNSRELQRAETQRLESREHAKAALDLASRIRDSVTPERWLFNGNNDPTPAKYDPDEIRQLLDVGILIADATVREVIVDASNFITAAMLVRDACNGELSTREIQVTAMIHLREVLGSYLRQEAPNPETVGWFRRHAAGLEHELEPYYAEDEPSLERTRDTE
ncbi:hypothetical protein PU630_07620 [Microbacterium horticulturae]|uniref:DUF4760 domain-containing protein n=1 Tax=Microbacterium horticulturae TaxID=3028316 RepID=A0ABY8C1S9_9MICO|nr:hypothetical protein [Microbacterium sp. KACC 23027]WEG10405.1 hypothetical protein PU630_07620 [Microbacterium sp. KACC 23027]